MNMQVISIGRKIFQKTTGGYINFQYYKYQYFTRCSILANMTMNDYEEKLRSQDKQVYDYIEGLKSKIAKLRKDLREPVIKFLTTENDSLKNEINTMKKQLQSDSIHLLEPTDSSPDKIQEKAEPSKDVSAATSVSNKGNSKKGVKPVKNNPASNLPVDVGLLDFRVGKIISVEKHPDADTLYIEQVDVGEETPRTVVSGLVHYYKLEDLQDQMVVLLCNLKPATMRGIKSHAMVMCASCPDKVEFLRPPVSSIPGDIVEFEGYERRPEPVLNPKRKIFESCAPDLKTDANGIATYKGKPFIIKDKGCVKAINLFDVQIK